jgi:pyridoxamine 5'-phosphate oxidase
MDDIREYINQLRSDFTKKSLSENDVNPSPILQFEKWFNEALDVQVKEPNAMTLATVSESGMPSARIVLLRNFSEQGFVFYTNYSSRKGKELGNNAKAALLFFWPELERQVRIEGTLVKQSELESDAYFNSRPRESKIGAWASPQSQIIKNRTILDTHFAEFEKQFAGVEVPRPAHWGGYVLQAVNIEFWQGRPSRLHDRILYSFINESWEINRLAP